MQYGMIRDVLQRSLRTYVFGLGGICVLFCCALCCSVASAQTQDDFPTGLWAQYQSHDRTIQRVDADVAFVWEADSPDQRLPGGPFMVDWVSQLLVRQEGRYVFHAYLQGDVAVELDGRNVLSGRRTQPGWVSGPEFGLSFGIKDLKVTFRKTEDRARVHLYWSSGSFPLEPIPSYLFLRDEPISRLSRIERGHKLFDAYRCNRCHQRANDRPSHPAPNLTFLTVGLNQEWLVQKLQNPTIDSAQAKMPSFGWTEAEAKAIAAFLLRNSQAVKLARPSRIKPKDLAKERRNGEILLRSLGCLACHRVGEYGSVGAYSGSELTRIGRKRSLDWIFTWLARPETLNPDHRMPIFKLTDVERRQLALALSTLATTEFHLISMDRQRVERGRQLVRAARCVACHQIPGIPADSANLPDLSDLSRRKHNWSDSCLSETPNRAVYRPYYSQIDRESVIAFVESRTGKLSPQNAFDHGRQVLEQRNCVSCHERDRYTGLTRTAGRIAQYDKSFEGQSQSLIPPALTAIGDKLYESALTKTVRGEEDSVRLPWLRVRMPKFQFQPPEDADLLSYLIGHDRIPDAAPTRPSSHHTTASSSELTDAETLLAGRTLVGPKGFSCLACHKIGEYEPRNVTAGTRGTDLLQLRHRMREEYFFRWTRSPLRIVPGMEMPSYLKAVPGILEGQIDRQLAAVWNAINDPRFKAPTNPSVVEQYLIVRPGEAPHIVRDVFTNPKENGGGSVVRAFAVGFNNGHSLLFDLDRFALRQWTFGDFARQRTVGKSWYWDMAGVPVVADFGAGSDIRLQDRGDGRRVIAPSSEFGMSGRLVRYSSRQDGVTLIYDVRFEIAHQVRHVRVTESLQTAAQVADATRTGWTRRMEFENVPESFDVLVARPIAQATLGSAMIEATEDGLEPSNDRQWMSLASSDDSASGRQFMRLPVAKGRTHVTLSYWSDLKRDSLEWQVEPPHVSEAVKITTVPGFDGMRLPFPTSIMPTAITWTRDGTLAFTSLKGHVYLAHDTDGDGLEDQLELFEDGLAAPWGLIADGDDLIVAHKPELLQLHDSDGDGRADEREVVATGWGYTDNYHDWTTGIVRDSHGNLYVGLGSDYTQPGRPRERSRWRGTALRIAPDGTITAIAHDLRYPTGLAINERDQVFASDNQGEQNCFNEVNYLVSGGHYGVPSLYGEKPVSEPLSPAIQIPHPWTRSVNGIFFLNGKVQPRELAGHGIGCEYNKRMLIRFTLQQVGETVQGATYYFTQPNQETSEANFLGPMCGAVSPDGHIYIGSLYDSGWLGGQNVGSIVRLSANAHLPNGIREIRARHDGFEVTFFAPVDRSAAAVATNYSISGYTRVWQGSYATPDSGRYRVNIRKVDTSADGKRVTLHVDRLREGFVYDISCAAIGSSPAESLWPNTGHYTMTRIP